MIRTIWRGRGTGRLAVQVGAVLAIAVMAVGLLTFAIADTWVSGRIDNLLRYHNAKYLTPADGHPMSGAELAGHIRRWEQRKIMSERTYVLFDKHGRKIAGRLDLRLPIKSGLSDVQFFGGGKRIQKGRAIATRLPDGGWFVIIQTRGAAAELDALVPMVVAALSLLSLIMGIAATAIFARLTARRLAQTQDTADAIAAGDLSRRIPTETLDGMFAVQAESLNRMLDRMENLVRGQRLFSSNLAHDLRTPLTRLQGLLAEGAADGDPQFAAVLAQAEHECASIINIFDALLRLAEIETGNHSSAMAPLALRPLIEDIADTMEPVLSDHGGWLEVARIEDVSINGDPDLINQLLVNLLENVANHTPKGTSATLSLEMDSGEALITMRDNGPGITAIDLACVTQPFRRGSSAANGKGSGLGLAIAQAIVRFHHGRLDIVNAEPGLQIRVRIPANDRNGPCSGKEPAAA